MSERKKICFLLSKFSKGGGERVSSILATELNKIFDVEVLLMCGQSSEDYLTTAKISEINHNKTIGSIFLLLESIYNLNKYIRRNKPYAIISFMELPNLVNLLVRGDYKKIISVRNHMSEKWGKRKNIWNWTIRHLYNNADIIVAPTQMIKDDLVDSYNIASNRIRVIYNPYVLSDYEFKINRDDCFRIVTMGSLVKAKGVYPLLYAYILFRNKHPEIKSELVYVGDGPEKEKLLLITKMHSVEDCVKLCVLASYYEGFPNAMVEAMICGVPIVATNCPSGPNEILTNEHPSMIDKITKYEYGYLMPVFSSDVEERISKLAEFFYDFYALPVSEKTELSRKAMERVKKYESSNIAKLWEKIII